MSKTLKLQKDKAIEAYKNGDAEIKKFLETSYPEHFKGDVKKRLTSYETACDILGIKPKTLEQFEALFDKEDARRQFARHRIVTGIKAINEDWVADFENENMPKYYNWMYNKNNGFSFVVDYLCDVADAASDLHVETREKAKIIQKVFKEDYIIYMFGY